MVELQMVVGDVSLTKAQQRPPCGFYADAIGL